MQKHEGVTMLQILEAYHPDIARQIRNWYAFKLNVSEKTTYNHMSRPLKTWLDHQFDIIETNPVNPIMGLRPGQKAQHA